MRLGERAEGRENNLNLIRMIAATGVLVSHAFPIASGEGTAEPLARIMGESLGGLSVLVFFGISGFLIAQSFERRRSMAGFLAARFLRIWPALFVVLLLAVAVMGPLVTALPLADYASHRETLIYLPQNLTLLIRHELPGVFETNPLASPVNGSLWTLKFEVACYGLVVIAGLLGLLTRGWLWALALLAFVAVYEAGTRMGGVPGTAVLLLKLSWAFVAGMALYVWRDRVILSPRIALACIGAAVLAHGTPVFREVMVLALVYVTFWLGYGIRGPLPAYNRLGDFSYGTYVFAFPVQQLSVHLAGPMTPLQNIAIALPVTLVLAVLSWHLVEKPALSLKPRAAEILARLGRRRAA